MTPDEATGDVPTTPADEAGIAAAAVPDPAAVADPEGDAGHDAQLEMTAAENVPDSNGPVTVKAPVAAGETDAMSPPDASMSPPAAEEVPDAETPPAAASPTAGYEPFLSMADKTWTAQKWEPRAAFVAALVSAGVLAVSSSSSWAHGTGRRPAGSSYVSIHASVAGHTISPLITAVTILAIAGAAAIPATRGRGRAVIGMLLALGGLTVDVQAADRRRAAVTRVYHLLGADTSAHAHSTVMWGVALLGGNLLFITGLLMVVRGQMWAGLSSRYERPAAGGTSAATAARGDAGTWDALDRGEDPTTAASTPWVAPADDAPHDDPDEPDEPVPAGV